MQYNIFLEQLKRSRKTIFYILLLTVTAAFFVASANLYQSSSNNLQQVGENYSTLAVMELYGDVDKYGNLTEENIENHVGYKAVAVQGYDVSSIIDSDCVESWDLRTQYGAYIEEYPALNGKMINGNGDKTQEIVVPRSLGQLIRFKLKRQVPVTLDLQNMQVSMIQLEVLDDAAGCFQYGNDYYFESFLAADELVAYEEQIKKVNRSDDTTTVTLYPDVEYVASIWPGPDWVMNDELGMLEPANDLVAFYLYYPWSDYGNFHVEYDEDKEELVYDEGDEMGSPFPVQRWEDVQNDPQLKAYYEKAWHDVGMQHYIYQVQTTNDITSVPAYHIGGASLCEGRLITQEEYDSGAMVCMVSEEQAFFQNWSIGDKLNIQLFETFYQPTERLAFSQPVWDSDENHFIHEGEYEIVGFYSNNPVTGNSDISANTLDMSIFNIYLPEKSVPAVQPLEERYVHSSLFSVKLKNGSIDDFISDMEIKGLTLEQAGQFNPKFTFFDQGYSLIHPGLEAMNSTAKLLLFLSSALILIVCILLAYFFWQNQKQTVGIFRLLGGTKKQAITAILLCVFILCVIGGVIGAGMGYGIAEFMGSEIMEENFTASERDSLFQPYVLSDGEGQESITVSANPILTAEASAVVLMFPAFLLIFICKDINKEPRELLPKSKA